MRLLNQLPAGVSRTNPTTYDTSVCRTPATTPGTLAGDTADDSEAYLLHASYRHGPDINIVTRLGWCGNLGASNGTRTGQRSNALATQLAALAGQSAGWPGDVNPAN